MSKTIMLIHGAWLTPSCWDSFSGRLEGQGYTVVAPPWPLMSRAVGELRRTPHRELGALTIAKIVGHYETLIRALPESPILIGHSFGGLFVQMLLERGLGAAGVAISPAPARGVFPSRLSLRASLPVFLAWGGWKRALTMTCAQFAWSFVHTLPAPEQREAFERYAVPAPGRLYYQTLFGSGNGVDFGRPDRAPLLLIGADHDRMVPVSMVHATYERYRVSEAVTALTSFTNRTHLLISMPGWEEVADYAIEWAATHSTSKVRTIPLERSEAGEPVASAAPG